MTLTLNSRVMWSVFAASGSKKKGGGKWSLKDFMGRRKHGDEQGAPQSPEQLLAMAVHLNAMIGGKDLRLKKEPDGNRA